MLKYIISIPLFLFTPISLKAGENNTHQTQNPIRTIGCFFNYKETKCAPLSQKRFQALQALGFTIASCGMTTNGLLRFTQNPTVMSSSDLVFSGLFCALSLKSTLERREES